MKLISMREFVQIEVNKLLKNDPTDVKSTSFAMADSYKRIGNYANFLSQPLTRGMFVRTDEDGNVLTLPEKPHSKHGLTVFEAKGKQYQQAKDRILFICEEYTKDDILDSNDMSIINESIKIGTTVEEIIDWELTLTQTAKNQIGLTN